MADNEEDGAGTTSRPVGRRVKKASAPPVISAPLTSFQSFLHQNGLADLLQNFPLEFTMGNFRAVTEDDFLDYDVKELENRARLMRAVNKAREEYDEREMVRIRRRSAADADNYMVSIGPLALQ